MSILYVMIANAHLFQRAWEILQVEFCTIYFLLGEEHSLYHFFATMKLSKTYPIAIVTWF